MARFFICNRLLSRTPVIASTMWLAVAWVGSPMLRKVMTHLFSFTDLSWTQMQSFFHWYIRHILMDLSNYKEYGELSISVKRSLNCGAKIELITALHLAWSIWKASRSWCKISLKSSTVLHLNVCIFCLYIHNPCAIQIEVSFFDWPWTCRGDQTSYLAWEYIRIYACL